MELGTWEDLLIKLNTLPNLERGRMTVASRQVISGSVGTRAPTIPHNSSSPQTSSCFMDPTVVLPSLLPLDTMCLLLPLNFLCTF